MVSPTDNQEVSRVREAAKRIVGAGRPNMKEPLSVEVLKGIVEGADLSNVLQLETCVCTCYPMRVFPDLRRFLIIE